MLRVQATSRADVIRIPAAHLSQVFRALPELGHRLGASALEMERVARSTELAPSGRPVDPFAALERSDLAALPSSTPAS